MPTIWDGPAREALLARFDRLEAATRPRWGRFNAGQMIRHCADALRMATGDLPVKPRPGLFRNPLVRLLIIKVLPWPKGAPTAPELIPPPEADLAAARADLRAALAKVALTGGRNLAPHPAFGELSPALWGKLIHRHLDHHLKQFGL